MSESGDIKTPVKTIYQLDLVASENFCALCPEEITNPNYRRKLYKLKDGKEEKTDICLEIEDVMGAQFNKLDLKIVCRNCYRQVNNITQKRKEQLEKFRKNQAEVKAKFVVVKSKRLSKDGGGQSRKKLEVGTSASDSAESNISTDNLPFANDTLQEKKCKVST